jgi:hypothetical protein
LRRAWIDQLWNAASAIHSPAVMPCTWKATGEVENFEK